MSTKFLKLAEIYDHSDQNQNIDCLSLLDLPCQLRYISLCGLAWSIFNGDPDFNVEKNILGYDDLVGNNQSEIVLSADAERDLKLVDRSQLGDQLLHLLPRWRQVQTGDKVVPRLSSSLKLFPKLPRNYKGSSNAFLAPISDK